MPFCAGGLSESTVTGATTLPACFTRLLVGGEDEITACFRGLGFRGFEVLGFWGFRF